MNNTNTFVYAIIYRYQGAGSLQYFKNRLRSLPPRRKAVPLVIGSFHLSFVAGLGLWFWIKIGRFGSDAQCQLQPPIFASILGRSIPMTDKILRRLSLALYGITAPPGVNVLIVATVIWGSIDLLLRYLPPAAFFLPGYLWVAILISINVIIIVDTEVMIVQTRASTTEQGGKTVPLLQAGESQWTFGQTLALFMLLLPLWDIAVSFTREQGQSTREDVGRLRTWFGSS